MSKKKKKEKMLRLTPQGLAFIALMDSGIIDNDKLEAFDFEKFDVFWNAFVKNMKEGGFC